MLLRAALVRVERQLCAFAGTAGIEKANSAMVIVIKTMALKANDQCTPIKPPTTPTVKPLNA